MARFDHAVPLLHDYLIASAARRPGEVALVYRGQRLTYADIDSRSSALARALARRGVGRGDRVVVFGDGSAETVIAFWAVLKANAVVSVVSSHVKVDKLAYVLDDCRARALVTEASLAPVFGPAAGRAGHLAAVIVSGAAGATMPSGLPGLARWDDAIGAEEGEPAPRRENLDVDLAAIIYTSGSTGEPKGVMLTHRNMLAAATSISAYLGNREDEVIFCALPLSFDYGLYQMIMAFREGARLVLERSFAYPAQALALMAREGVTAFPGVPTMFALLAELEDLSGHDLSRVRYVTNTAAALSERHVARIEGLFPRARIFSMYGLTECKRCTYLPPEDLHRKPGSVGVAIPNTELWVVDEQGGRLGPNQVGELVIRGATVMKGYWEKPEETARRLRPGPIPGEQVLYTGDLCRVDEDGYVTFVGRMDDIIKSRGEKVAPREVEAALTSIPGVKEAAVKGVPDKILGAAVKAWVVLEASATLSEKDLERACQARLEPFMVPKHVVIVPELPRTTTGKIKKTDLA